MSRDQAALLGSEYERWSRLGVQAPLWIPQRYAQFRPLNASQVLDVVDQNRTSPRANGTIANLYEAREKLVSSSRRRVEGYVAAHKVKSNCECCLGYVGAAHSPQARALQSPLERVPEFHSDEDAGDPPLIQFDQDTWETTITETVTFDLKTAQVPDPLHDPGFMARVLKVLKQSSPENWKDASVEFADQGKDPFFIDSTPGIWKAGDFGFASVGQKLVSVPQAAQDQAIKAWASAEGGQLREISQWSSGFGAGSDSGATIFITIRNYKAQFDLAQGPPSLSFDYVLHHCAEYKLGSTTLHDILDVDGGHFEGSLQGTKFVVTGVKSIHFRAPTATDQETAIFLNLVAPATTAMLMRELVYEGTLKLLNDLSKPALGTGPPPVTSAPARAANGNNRLPKPSNPPPPLRPSGVVPAVKAGAKGRAPRAASADGQRGRKSRG
jgi:hypothetical protein